MSSSTERQRRYRERMRAAGFVQVEVVVRPEMVPTLRKIAAASRREHLAKQAQEEAQGDD